MFLNHIIPTSTASKHTTFGPDAFTPEFVKAVQTAASDAPPVTYDGEAFVCGEVTLRCHAFGFSFELATLSGKVFRSREHVITQILVG